MNDSNSAAAPRPACCGGRAIFLAHLAVIAVLLAAATWRSRHMNSAAASLPSLREAPLVVGPLYNDATLINDQDLKRVLARLLPRAVGPAMKINHVDHALRFWGAEAEFTQPGTLSGEEMRRILTDHNRFQEIYGAEVAAKKPLLMAVEKGVNVRMQEGEASSSHHDHTLACLAEVGTRLDAPLFVYRPARPSLPWRLAARAGLYAPAPPIVETTYKELIEQSLRNFSLNQVEYEWSGLAYVLFFAEPGRRWRTTEGQEIDFSRLARRMLREGPARGVCFGNHRLYTLVLLLRVNELQPPEAPLLDEPTREEIVAYLENSTRQLVANQHAQGCWNIDWPFAKPGDVPSEAEGDRVGDRILATGHALEWWAMVPESLRDRIHPPHATLVDACQYLVRTVDGLSDEKIQDNFTFLTHAGRALALWRGVSPGAELANLVRPEAAAQAAN